MDPQRVTRGFTRKIRALNFTIVKQKNDQYSVKQIPETFCNYFSTSEESAANSATNIIEFDNNCDKQLSAASEESTSNTVDIPTENNNSDSAVNSSEEALASKEAVVQTESDAAAEFFKSLHLGPACIDRPSDQGFVSDNSPEDEPRSVKIVTQTNGIELDTVTQTNEIELDTVTQTNEIELDTVAQANEIESDSSGFVSDSSLEDNPKSVEKVVESAEDTEETQTSDTHELLDDNEDFSDVTKGTLRLLRKRKNIIQVKKCIIDTCDTKKVQRLEALIVALSCTSVADDRGKNPDISNCKTVRIEDDTPCMADLSIPKETSPCRYPIINKESIRDKYKPRLSVDKNRTVEVPQIIPQVVETTLSNSVRNEANSNAPIWSPTNPTVSNWRPYDNNRPTPPDTSPKTQPSNQTAQQNSIGDTISSQTPTIMSHHQNRVPMLPIEHSNGPNMLRPPELLTPPLTPKRNYKKQMLQLHQQQLAAAQTQVHHAPVPEPARNNRRNANVGSRKRNASERERPSILERVPQVAPEEFMLEIAKENETIRQRLRLHGAQTVTLGPNNRSKKWTVEKQRSRNNSNFHTFSTFLSSTHKSIPPDFQGPLVRDELLQSKRIRSEIPSSMITPPAEPLLQSPVVAPATTVEPVIDNPVNSYLNNVEPISDEETPVALMKVPEPVILADIEAETITKKATLAETEPRIEKFIWQPELQENDNNLQLLAFQERMQDKLHMMYGNMVKRIVYQNLPYVPHCLDKSLEERMWSVSLIQRLGYKKHEEGEFLQAAQELLSELEMYFHKQHSNKEQVLSSKDDALASLVLYAIKHRIFLPRLLDAYPDLLATTTSLNKVVECRDELIQRYLYHKQTTETTQYVEEDPKDTAQQGSERSTQPQQVSVIRSTLQAREEFNDGAAQEIYLGMNKDISKRAAKSWPTIVLSDSEDEGDAATVAKGYVRSTRGIIGERSISATFTDGYSNLYNFQKHVGDPKDANNFKRQTHTSPILSNSFIQSSQIRRRSIPSLHNSHHLSEVVQSLNSDGPLNLQKTILSNDELTKSLNLKQSAQTVNKPNNGQTATNKSISKKVASQRSNSSSTIFRTASSAELINSQTTLASSNFKRHAGESNNGIGSYASNGMSKSPRNLSLRDNLRTINSSIGQATTNLQVLNQNLMQQNCLINDNGATLASRERPSSHLDNNNLTIGSIPFAFHDVVQFPSTRNLRDVFQKNSSANQIAFNPHDGLSEKTVNNGNMRTEFPLLTSPTVASMDNPTTYQKRLQMRHLSEMVKSPTSDPYIFSENEKQINTNNFGKGSVRSSLGELVKSPRSTSREGAFIFQRQLSQISTGSSTGSVNDDRSATLLPQDYVIEMKRVEKLDIAEDFKNFYEFVTKSQITNGNEPICFNMFLELLNAGNLKTYQKKYVEYLKMKDRNIVSNK